MFRRPGKREVEEGLAVYAPRSGLLTRRMTGSLVRQCCHRNTRVSLLLSLSNFSDILIGAMCEEYDSYEREIQKGTMLAILTEFHDFIFGALAGPSSKNRCNRSDSEQFLIDFILGCEYWVTGCYLIHI